MKCDKCQKLIENEALYIYTWHPRKHIEVCEDCFLWKNGERSYDLDQIERFLNNFDIIWVGNKDSYEYLVFELRQESLYEAYEELLRRDVELKAEAMEKFLNG